MPLFDPLSTLLSSFQTSQIIPDIIPSSYNTTNFPSVLFSVVYPSLAAAGREVTPGVELNKEDTQDEPEIVLAPMNGNWDDATSGGGGGGGDPSYTLVMTDPDAPSRKDPKYGQFRHWVITGLKSPATTASEASNLIALKTGISATPYRGPGPPPGTGLHRYVFLLFEEPVSGYSIATSAPEHGSALESRRNWDAIKFAEQHGLKLVGGTWFAVRGEEKSE